MDYAVLAERFSKEQMDNPFRFLYENIFGALARAIAIMEIGPGEELQETNLAEAMNVSRTPIRQAFAELEKIDFVTLVPGRGCIVSTIDWYDFEEFAAIRKAIEPACARLAALRAERGEVEQLWRILEKAKMNESMHLSDLTSAFYSLETSFHATVCRMSKNKYLIKAYNDMSRQLTRNRYFYASKVLQNCVRPLTIGNRDVSSYDEHLVIYQAIKAGNSGLAFDAMSHHMERLVNCLPNKALHAPIKS